MRLIIVLLAMNSCNCPDDVYYKLPSEAVRYYEENDTIQFFSEETQSFEKFIVCDRIDAHEVERTEDRCKQGIHYFMKIYDLYEDSCNSDHYFRLFVKSRGDSDFVYDEFYKNDSDDLWANYNDSPKTTVEILGHTYENTIFIQSVFNDSLNGIRVSYEFGIIQRVFEHTTFNLVNDEIR